MNLIHVIRGAFSFSFKFTISCPNNLKVGILYPIIGKSIQWKQCFMFISFLYKWIGKLEFSFKEVKPHPLHIVAEKNIFQQLSLGYFCWYFAKYMDWRKKNKGMSSSMIFSTTLQNFQLTKDGFPDKMSEFEIREYMSIFMHYLWTVPYTHDCKKFEMVQLKSLTFKKNTKICLVTKCRSRSLNKTCDWQSYNWLN